jgi:hypothetical protein
MARSVDTGTPESLKTLEIATRMALSPARLLDSQIDETPKHVVMSA